VRASVAAIMPKVTPSWCTSGLAGQAADVIISTTHFDPVHGGLRVRSNLRRRVGHLYFQHSARVHQHASRQGLDARPSAVGQRPLKRASSLKLKMLVNQTPQVRCLRIAWTV